MPVDEKGIFPAWMDEDDITTQLINQIIKRGGKVPYAFVINPEQSYATQERMKKILNTMFQYKILLPLTHEFDDLELGIGSNVVARVGFKKFKRMQKRRAFNEKLFKITRILFIPIVAAICILLILIFFHFFNKR